MTTTPNKATDGEVHYNTCVICGKKFQVFPSDPKKCCSYACYQKLKDSMVQQKTVDALLQGNLDYIDAHQGELHHAAKTYIMESPSGDLVEVTNLKYWCRNSGHFDKPDRAYKNFVNISGTIQGTSGRQPQYSYHGWKIAFVDDTAFNAHKPTPKTCPICGAELPPQRKTYCSDDCKAEGRRRRDRQNWEKRYERIKAKKEKDKRNDL